MPPENQGLSQAEIDALAEDLDESGMPKEDEGADVEDDEDEGNTPAAENKAAAEAAEQDDDDDGQEDDAPVKPAAQAESKDDKGTINAEALAAVAADGDDADPELLQAPETDFKAERAKIVEKEADIDKRWSDGTLTDEERATELAKVRDERDALLRQEVRAETIADLNRQAIHRAQTRKLDALRADGKQHGIDYSGEEHAGAFDAALSALRTQKANATLSFSQLADKAHAMVLAMNGVSPASKAADTKGAAKETKPAVKSRGIDKAVIPPTLSRVPPAADATISGDEFSHLSSLSGADLEKAVTRMTTEQQERWLNA